MKFLNLIEFFIQKISELNLTSVIIFQDYAFQLLIDYYQFFEFSPNKVLEVFFILFPLTKAMIRLCSIFQYFYCYFLR